MGRNITWWDENAGACEVKQGRTNLGQKSDLRVPKEKKAGIWVWWNSLQYCTALPPKSLFNVPIFHVLNFDELLEVASDFASLLKVLP